MERIKTLSLFTGAGGLDIGFSRAGFNILGCVEIEPVYCNTLDKNHGPGLLFPRGTKIHCEDIREFNPREYSGAGIECVVGGPPCQTFSAAGRRSGGVLGTSDARGRLFKSYCQVLHTLRPKAFIFENVYGLPGANGGGPWREICSAFSELGYSLSVAVLDAADYGVPQHRERLIIVGVLRGFGTFRFPLPTHGPDSATAKPLVSVLDAIKDLQSEDEPFHELDGLYGDLLAQVPEGLNYAFFTQEMGYPQPHFAWRSKFHDFLYKVDPNAPARTIKAQPGKFTGPFHWKNRHFTVAELKRLQTFPDEYQFVGSFTKVMEQIGNSVPPLLAEVLAVSVRQQILRPTKDLTYPVRPVGFKSSFRQRQRERTKLFKAVASAEISKRFPKIEPIKPRPKSTKELVVAYEGLFEKRVRAKGDRACLGETAFKVSIEKEQSQTRVTVERLEPVIQRMQTFELTISGLAKYLITVDSLLCTAKIAAIEDIFKVWDIVEDALTKGSQFFTLIDIYGHYANRGDTVRVKTEICEKKLSEIERAINFFGDSQNCGFFFDQRTLCDALKIDEKHLMDVIQELRSMRWDVRNASTHATITQDGVICTYPFPLLSEKAQLQRKMLETATG
jgi:DNA (cytosine-5)-methyltransferase 1